MKYRNYLVLLLIVIFAACKSVKPITESGKLDATVTSKQLIKAHNKKEANFKTLQAKVKVEFVQGAKSQTHTVNLRIEKNKTIWISAKFAILRVKITPQKVSFYNELDNTYFDGDFTLISELLGTKLNFKNLQNLLLGIALFDLDKKAYEADTYETSYILKPYNQDSLFEIFYLINTSYFLMDSQQLAQPQE